MTQDYDIRRAAPSDLDAILSFQRAAIAAVSEAYYSRAAREAWVRTPALGLPDLIAEGRYYVAATKEILVAGGGWQPSGQEAGAATAGFTRVLVPSALNATGFYEKLGYHVGSAGGFELNGVHVGTCNMWKSVA